MRPIEKLDVGPEHIRRMGLSDAIRIAMDESPSDARHSRKVDREWNGGVTFDEAITMASKGYRAGALRLNQRLGILTKIRENVRPKARWQTSGSQVDMGRFMSGEPDNMVEIVRVKAQAPVLRIALERAVSWSTSVEDIEATGTSVLAAVEALRTAGIPSEVWVTFTIGAWDGKSYLSTQVCVQEAGRPIDLDMLAYWTCHPSAFRRIGFSIEEKEDIDLREKFGIKMHGGYGSPANPRDMKATNDFDEIAPAYARQCEEWLEELLMRRIGITIKGGEI